MRNIEDYGNKLSIVGMILGNGEEGEIIYITPTAITSAITPTPMELVQIFNQLDTLAITNSEKTILRKSQRQIDQIIAWEVYRRDSFKCVYCGNDHIPLTVDHLVLWEEMGDTVPANLVAACKKCNHTRGNKPLHDFLDSSYYKDLALGNFEFANKDFQLSKRKILDMYEYALTLPKRKPRSR